MFVEEFDTKLIYVCSYNPTSRYREPNLNRKYYISYLEVKHNSLINPLQIFATK